MIKELQDLASAVNAGERGRGRTLTLTVSGSVFKDIARGVERESPRYFAASLEGAPWGIQDIQLYSPEGHVITVQKERSLATKTAESLKLIRDFSLRHEWLKEMFFDEALQAIEDLEAAKRT